MSARHEPQGRLITRATALLGTESPWLVVSATPARPAPGALGTDHGDQLRRWVAQQVADWPAPIPLGTEPPDLRPDLLAFAPPRSSGRPVSTYYCELHADGSALGALQVGMLCHSPPDGSRVWALGEGAVAWITIAMLRLVAAFVRRASGGVKPSWKRPSSPARARAERRRWRCGTTPERSTARQARADWPGSNPSAAPSTRHAV
ncbi:hypothetical protein GCM10010095_83290 [Streptomyces anthocyanicus]|nr:hypothetical protein GCM10010095_83290 [Streptomyces anthocyanicus]